jgi:hypothetical protein
MAATNPDFRGGDVVVPPPNYTNLMGWTDGRGTLRDAVDRERRGFGRLEADYPVAFQTPRPRAVPAVLRAKWDEFQMSKGRYPGSMDLSLLDEWVAGKPLLWLPQIIGSCVMSNTLRAWVSRLMYQITLLGEPQEYLGRNEFGQINYSFYGPWTYGRARQRANMRGGDGLYCEPMAETLLKDGVIPCNTPALLAITKTLGVDGDRDYPEPQSAKVYRAFGDWKHIDELKPYADYPCTGTPLITSAEGLWQSLQDGAPAFVCSGEAIHKVGTHPDGFPIHARNPRDSWAHNMHFAGAYLASDGERFFRECNQSWGAEHVYNRRYDEVDKAIRTGQLTIAAIAGIRGPASAAPSIA